MTAKSDVCVHMDVCVLGDGGGCKNTNAVTVVGSVTEAWGGK